jgi:putative PIN family toxin of toxin-antitoxin system
MALREPSSIMAKIVESWYDDAYLLVCSDETLREYRDTLVDPANLTDHSHEIRVHEFLELVEVFAERAQPALNDLPPIRDEHDRIWLAAAIGAQANYLVTVDRDFLDDADLIRAMRARGVDITRPGLFLREIERG